MTDQERYHNARRDPALVVLEGFHAIKHALRFGAHILDIVTTSPGLLRDLAASHAPELANAFGSARELRTAIDSLTPTPPRTEVIAIAERPHIEPLDVFHSTSRKPIVVLDRPRHLGNIGAAIRVAAAAGAAGLFTTGDADPWGPAAIRGAAGLQFALPVARLHADRPLPPTTRAIIAVDPAGDTRPTPSGAPGTILLFGSERDGISPTLLAQAHALHRIPMRPGVSSLNLATAVAIMLYTQLPATTD